MEVFGQPVPDGYEIPFVLTLILITVKAGLSLFLLAKIAKRHQEQNVFALTFLGSVFLFMLLAAIARVFYMIFDYFQTGFNVDLYADVPNIWFWKIGSLLSSFGIVIIIWVLDKKILGNKFKGIFAIIMAVGVIFQFVYPVNDFADFQFVSTIGVVASLGAFLIPILFFYIGANTPGLRKIAYAIAVGAIIYTVGGAMVSATFIAIFNEVLGFTTDIVYLISISMKVAGLLAIAYGGVHFKT